MPQEQVKMDYLNGKLVNFERIPHRLVPNKYVFFYAFPYLNGKYHKNIIKLDYLN